jgi:tetratricopeptide (TPR) repeat protein
MALIDPGRARIGAILFLLTSQGAERKPADLTAVLTQIDGPVTLSSEGRVEFRSVRRAAQRQIIRRGEVVHVPAGAQVKVICSTETLVSLKGPRDWVLDTPTCGQGVPLPAKSYRNLASYAGRILPRNGALLLELETRNVDVGRGPILLSPRNTAVMEAHPRLVWAQVPDAVEYEIQIRGPVGSSIRLAAGDLHCGRGAGPWHDLDVCSWASSDRWPALEPERPVFLKLGSRQAATAPLRQVQEVYEIHLLQVSEQQGVQEGLRQISTLPLDKASRLLLAAGAYAQGGLYADAIATYDEALQAQEMPEARVTLGDLYLTIGLTALAGREYRQVLAGAPDRAAQAAAELGLGQVTYLRTLFGDSRSHFERARELYTTLGLTAEAEEARAAAARAQASTRNQPP